MTRSFKSLVLLAFLASACDDTDATTQDAQVDQGAEPGFDQGPQDTGAAEAGRSDAAVDAGPDAVVDAALPEGCAYHTPADSPPEPRRHTPRWAFKPWISKDISTRDDTFAFVGGFQDRDIPVGVVVLDSPWETHYNTFEPSPTRYPDFGGMVTDLRARGVRTVLWITPQVNQTGIDLEAGGDLYRGPAPNLAEGQRCGFFVNDGALHLWWKGQGAAVDFLNPHARGWWHRQQDALLDLGVAGWKLDFGDQYVRTDPVLTAAGPVPHQTWSEAYYRDFLAYAAARNGVEEFVTMVRPWDESYEHAGRFFARPEHAPVGWVGDNRRDWVGLIDALDHIFRSAQAGYVVVGADLGGYLDRDDQALSEQVPYSRETFFRWTAQAALTPFMQLHGRANLTPWTLPDGGEEESVRIYRFWSWLHTSLIPFWYSLAEAAYAGGEPIIRPIGDGPEQWANDWRYLLGDALLVAPLLADGGIRDVILPAGERWYDWWRPLEPALDGGQTLRGYAVNDPGRIPLFVREGAIIPLDVVNDVNGLGDAESAGKLTVLAWPGRLSTFRLVDEDDQPTEIATQVIEGRAEIRLSRVLRPTLLRVRTLTAVGVRLNGADHAAWRRDPAAGVVVVEVPAGGAATVEVLP